MQTRSSKPPPRPSSPAHPLRADTPQPSLAAPRPSAGPSRLQRLLINPPDISDNSSIPFSALISRTTSALNAPNSDSPVPSLPHTPSPDPPAQPTTPSRPTAPAWDIVDAPIPAPEFGARDSQDSSLAAPAQTLRFPEIHNSSTSPSDAVPTKPNQQSTFQLNPAFASATTLPCPLLLPAFAAANNYTLPQPAPPMTQSTLQRAGTGPAAMPPPRSHRAPYFSGRVGDPIEDFLTEYEELANSCSLSDRQKVETVIRYIPLPLRDLWKSLDGYLARDWIDLKLTIEEIYDDTSALSRHSEQKLLDFVRQSSKSRMSNEEDVLQYYRHFLVLSKPLLDSHRLTSGERDRSFWRGFHSRDRAEMYARLIAKHPDQPAGVHFDYLDVYRVARATFSGNHLLDLELDDPWEEPQSLRSSRLERTRERWLDSEERDPRGADPSHRIYERRRPPSPVNYVPWDSHLRRTDTRPPPPEMETKVVRFKEPAWEEEDREMEDLMKRMHGLSVHEESYAVLYTRCAHRFPNVAQNLPKPILSHHVPTPTSAPVAVPAPISMLMSAPAPATSFSFQTPALPPPPARQPWAPTANLAHHTSDPSSFFCTRVRTEGCSFCQQPSHRIRECPMAQEYIRSGRALVSGDRLYLPNGQPIPNDGTGHGLRHGIDTWLAAQPQAQGTPAPTQQVSFACEAPPHFPRSFDNRAPAAHIEEVSETHIVQIVGMGQLDSDSDEDSDLEGPFDFFQVFATERKKRETRASKMPELRSSTRSSAPITYSAPATATPIASTPSTPTTTSISAPTTTSVPAPTATSASAPTTTSASAPTTTANPAKASSATTTTSTSNRTPQYRYQSTAEDYRLISELESWLMEGKLAQTTPAHVLAASPVIRKDLVEKLRVRRVEAGSFEEATNTTLNSTTGQSSESTHSASLREPAYSLPLREIDIQIGGKVTEAGIIDPGSQIVVIRADLAREVGAAINANRVLQMEGANGATNWTLGCAEYLPMQAGNIPFHVHAHVVEHAPFRLLLGRPFQHALLCRIEDLSNGDVEVSVSDPTNPLQRISIPSRPRKVQVASVRILTLSCPPQLPPSASPLLSTSPSLSPLPSSPLPSSPLPSSPLPSSLLPLSPLPPLSTLPSQSLLISQPRSPILSVSKSQIPPQTQLYPSHPNNITSVQAYKKVAKKVRPVPTSLPEDFRTIRRIPSDPLLSLPELPHHPPNFSPGNRLNQERLDALKLNQDNFLWPEELKLLQHILKLNELGLAWTEEEKGRFRDDYFSPVKIPVIEHIPWAHRNLPIPSGILADVIQIFKDKFAAGVYEHSDASYRSRWFCVEKKSGALRLVHDLQPLNAITIRNSGVPPLADQLIESMAGRACYSMLDLFVGYDHRTLDVSSRDLTTIQSPIGTVRLTCLLQGWTNAGAIFHEDVTFILEPEIPHVAWPYMDDCSIKGPATRYKNNNGGFDTIPNNPGIRTFIWQHLSDVHCILHRLRCAGATVSAKKLFIAVPEVIILGHKCNYEGRVPDDSKIARIRDWPTCKNLRDVRAFLGTAGFMRIWIKNFSVLARPLVNLTRKEQAFIWTEEHDQAMEALKNAIINSPSLISIDYSSDYTVHLAIDSSTRGVGWILSQDCDDGKRRPSRFGSISWNERESRYSQAKLELYGLFRALRSLRLHLIGIRNLVIEMDAQFVKGMLSNPDIQPNATINRWIAAILFFNFKLVHIPAEKHQGPDGLSRREPAEGEEEEDDPEEWIDQALSLGLWISSWLLTPQSTQVFALTQASLVNNTAAGDPVEFPVADKALEAEEHLARVEQYLWSLRLPSGLDNKATARLLRSAARFFLLNDRLWRRQGNGRHQLYIPSHQRLPLVHDAHNNLGHKGLYSTRRTLLDCFWWPAIEQDIKWYIDTCHQCQLRQTTKLRIPPTVAAPAPLFRKAYIDTMFMPLASGFRYIVQARCSLTAWPEWRALRTETGRTLGTFIFEEILCRWGAVEEIVTDNGTAYVAALDWLANKYGIRHIRISAYNSRANGIVERQHRTIRESLIKACQDNISKWPDFAPLIFWADRATTRKSTGHSPFYMAHGIEPILPFDLTLATFLVPDLCAPLSTADLLATRARQLQKRQEDLDNIHDRILKSRFISAQQFEKQHQNLIKDLNFKPGDLVLIRNASADSELARKTKPRYFGPMVVVRRTRNGAYRLAELDGAVSKLCYAAFRIIPYFSRSRTSIPVTRLLDREDLAALVKEEALLSSGAPDGGDDRALDA